MSGERYYPEASDLWLKEPMVYESDKPFKIGSYPIGVDWPPVLGSVQFFPQTSFRGKVLSPEQWKACVHEPIEVPAGGDEVCP